jgi:hypothetical protein
MKLSQKSYHSKISLIILAGYLFITVLSIFHCHPFDFNAESIVDIGDKSKKTDPNFFIVSEMQCVIQNNYQALNNAQPQFSNAAKNHIFQLQFVTISYSENTLNNYIQSSNYLRAPPNFIS